MLEFYNAARGPNDPMPLSNALFQALIDKGFVVYNMWFGVGPQGIAASVIVGKFTGDVDYKEQVDLDPDELQAVIQELAVKRGYVGDIIIRRSELVTPTEPFLKRKPGQALLVQTADQSSSPAVVSATR